MKVDIQKAYRIDCEYCTEYLMEYSKDVVLRQAKELGWHIYKGENCCPDCYKHFKSE